MCLDYHSVTIPDTFRIHCAPQNRLGELLSRENRKKLFYTLWTRNVRGMHPEPVCIRYQTGMYPVYRNASVMLPLFNFPPSLSPPFRARSRVPPTSGLRLPVELRMTRTRGSDSAHHARRSGVGVIARVPQSHSRAGPAAATVRRQSGFPSSQTCEHEPSGPPPGPVCRQTNARADGWRSDRRDGRAAAHTPDRRTAAVEPEPSHGCRCLRARATLEPSWSPARPGPRPGPVNPALACLQPEGRPGLRLGAAWDTRSRSRLERAAVLGWRRRAGEGGFLTQARPSLYMQQLARRYGPVVVAACLPLPSTAATARRQLHQRPGAMEAQIRAWRRGSGRHGSGRSRMKRAAATAHDPVGVITYIPDL
jgi:hypothetical protein